MTAFRYVAVDLRSGQLVATLPLHDVTFTSILLGAGPLRAKLRLPPPKTTEALALIAAYKDATEETRRAIYIEHDGTVLWAGPIWSTEYDTDTGTIDITGAEMWSYWRRRAIRWDANYNDVDQVAIAHALINRSQNDIGGNLGFAAVGALAGELRDARYRFWEEKPVAEAIDDLARVDDGFDFAARVLKTGDTYERRFETFYPRRGRTVTESHLAFTLGGNMLRLTYPRNGARAANSVVSIGAGEGRSMRRATATDDAMIAAGYPLLEDSESYKDARNPTQLQGHARAQLAAKRRPVTLPKATVDATTPKLGTYEPGDDALLVVPAGQDPYWPDGFSTTARITQITCSPPDGGAPATAELTFEERAA